MCSLWGCGSDIGETHVWLQDTDGRYDADITELELCAYVCIYVSIGENVSYNCI